MRRSCLPAATALLVLLSPPVRAAPDLPEWLGGTWAMESGSAWADEVWTSARGGMMLGFYRQGFGSGVEAWESLRIERKAGGALVLVMQAKGGAGTEYGLAVAGANSIEFTNPAASFPQRIRYWREGQLLMTEMARMDGSEAVRMNFRPVETAPRD